MARECMVTGKGTTRGNHVAHCNKKQRRSFKANVHWKRFWVESNQRFVRLLVSNKGIRMIDKLGIDVVLARVRARGVSV